MRRNNKTLLLLLVLASLVLLITGTFAAYTNVGTIKRVISTRSGVNELRFSSNYLAKSGEGYPPRSISIAEGSGVSIGVTVCNYSRDDLTLFSESPITYTLTVRLVDAHGAPITDDSIVSYTAVDGTAQTISGGSLKGKILINGIPFSGDSYTATKTLPANAANHNLYSITCSGEDYPILRAIAIQIEAVPSSGVSQRLAGQLQVTTATIQSTDWQGRFIDPAGVDAYNYEIFGSAQGTMTLSWDASLIINPSFCEEVNGTQTGNSISFPVGGPGQPNRHRIQFYKATDPCTANVDYHFSSTEPTP